MSALSIFLATSYAQVVFSKVVSNLPLRAETTWGIQEVIDGYIAVSAIFCSYDEQKICCVIFKLNKEGDIAWFEQFDFYPNAYASLAVRENKIYLCGSTNQGDKQFLLYCLDLEGNIIWSREYGNPTQDELGPTFTFTSDNHIVLCGIRMPNTAGIPLQVVYLVKTDLDGNLVAEYSYGFQNDQSLGRTVIETTDRQMIFSYGACPVSCFVEFTAGVASVDTLGNLNWNLAFPFAFQPDRPHVIQTDSQTLVANWHTHTALPNHDLEPPTLFYLNRSGQIQSQLVLENQSLKAIDDLAPLWGKGLVGSGSNYPHYLTDPNPDPAGWVFRVNENRELLWDRTYTDTAFQGKAFGLQSIVPTSDGGYIAVGTIANHMTGVFESHNWILKLDSMGCLQPGCGEINYVTTTEEVVFLKGKNIKVYPNPADHYVDVQFPADFPRGNNMSVQLVSNTGVFLKKQAVSTAALRLDLANIPAGICYVVIRRGNEIITSRKITVHH